MRRLTTLAAWASLGHTRPMSDPTQRPHPDLLSPVEQDMVDISMQRHAPATPAPTKPADRGPWMQTYSGKCFYPLDPRPEDISLVDIAHALSICPRYAGHSREPYSVAQHSILVADTFARDIGHVTADTAALRGARLIGLLHDAAEAYICDLPRPLKSCLPEYKAIEHRIEEAIRQHFALRTMRTMIADDIALMIALKRADRIVLATERRDIMNPCEREWDADEQGFPLLTDTIVPWGWREAEVKYTEALTAALAARA